jgi:hypothetical protein
MTEQPLSKRWQYLDKKELTSEIETLEDVCACLVRKNKMLTKNLECQSAPNR